MFLSLVSNGGFGVSYLEGKVWFGRVNSKLGVSLSKEACSRQNCRSNRRKLETEHGRINKPSCYSVICDWGSIFRVISPKPKCGATPPIDGASMIGCRLNTSKAVLGYPLGPSQGPFGWSLGSRSQKFQTKYVYLQFRILTYQLRAQKPHETRKGTPEHTSTSKHQLSSVLVVLGSMTSKPLQINYTSSETLN